MCLYIAARGARKAARKGKTKARASTTGTVTCGAAHARLEDSLSLGLGDTRTVICHRVGDGPVKRFGCDGDLRLPVSTRVLDHGHENALDEVGIACDSAG